MSGKRHRKHVGATPATVRSASDISLTQLAALIRDSSASYTFSGAVVTLDTALTQAAAWACITRLKSTISSLPIDVIRMIGKERKILDTRDQPQIIRSPSGLVSRRNWMGQIIHAATTAGNIYGDIVSMDDMGRPTTIESIHSSRVSYMNGQFFVDGVPRKTWPSGDLWHVPISHLMVDGTPIAMSPVLYGRQSISTALSAEKYGGNFFRAGGAPTTVLSSKTSQKQDQIEAAKRAVLQATENHGVVALGANWSLDNFNIDPKDTQFLDLLEFCVIDACRRWMVPPAMVYAAVSGQNVTYSNITSSDLTYLKHSVVSWVLDLEDSMFEMIPRPLTAKFNVNAVLRGDAAARSAEHKIRLETKTRTVNEVRNIEDEDPFDDPIYDQPGIPPDPTPEPDPNAVADPKVDPTDPTKVKPTPPKEEKK